jgi:hypothetical protein
VVRAAALPSEPSPAFAGEGRVGATVARAPPLVSSCPQVRFSCHAAAAAVSALAVLAACGDTAAVLTIRSDLAVPAEIDGVCVSVADQDPAGGEFARFYPLDEGLTLPQTLTVEPGSAAAAVASARGTLRGQEVARDVAAFRFSGVETVPLDLRACRRGRTTAPAVVDQVAIPAGARAQVSFGRGGSLIVVLGADTGAVYEARGGALRPLELALPPRPSEAAPVAIVALDADGDCDDDLLILWPDAPPSLWRREPGPSLSDAPEAFAGAGLTPARAAAAADVDGDGDVDLVIGSGPVLRLLRNDGAGVFRADGAAIGGGVVTDVTALALGDIDGDGLVDVVVGQGDAEAAPARVLLNDAAGTGSFVPAVAVLPEVPLRARGLAVVDLDGDGFRDLLVVADGQPARAYVNRGDGRLEDRSFLVLPSLDVDDGASLAAGDWTGDCGPDVVIGRADGAPLSWRSAGDGSLVAEPFADAAGAQVLLADLDDDGVLDALVVGDGQMWWVRR